MPQWVIIFLVGMLGGLVNGYLAAGGLVTPNWFVTRAGKRAWDPGIGGNVAVGAVAGLIAWGLNNPGASLMSAEPMGITTVIGALLAGLGGARVLSSYVDKTIAESNDIGTKGALDDITDTLLLLDEEQKQ